MILSTRNCSTNSASWKALQKEEEEEEEEKEEKEEEEAHDQNTKRRVNPIE